jgi:hypothetical protein
MLTAVESGGAERLGLVGRDIGKQAHWFDEFESGPAKTNCAQAKCRFLVYGAIFARRRHVTLAAGQSSIYWAIAPLSKPAKKCAQRRQRIEASSL